MNLRVLTNKGEPQPGNRAYETMAGEARELPLTRSECAMDG